MAYVRGWGRDYLDQQDQPKLCCDPLRSDLTLPLCMQINTTFVFVCLCVRATVRDREGSRGSEFKNECAKLWRKILLFEETYWSLWGDRGGMCNLCEFIRNWYLLLDLKTWIWGWFWYTRKVTLTLTLLNNPPGTINAQSSFYNNTVSCENLNLKQFVCELSLWHCACVQAL